MKFRCINCGPEPGSAGWQEGFTFEADKPVCPKCGRFGPMTISPVVDVHLMVEMAAGPILGASARYYVACQPKRDALARHAHDSYAASADILAVTCPSCKGTRAYQEQLILNPHLAERDRIQKALQADCCG